MELLLAQMKVTYWPMLKTYGNKLINPIFAAMIIFENNRIFKDSRKIKIMQQLCQNVAILRRDKGNSVDLLDSQDYVNSVE